MSLTAPMKSCSPSASVKTSYTLQADTREGIGGGGSPVIAYCCMCWDERNTQFSNSALCTSCPLPVRSRSRSAASTPIAPNMPPMMSLTEVPARSGRPTGPVMYDSPPIICTTSSSARRFS